MPPASKANGSSANNARQWRKLRGYAFDPILSQQFETAGINEIVFRAPWEPLSPGPIGDYLEVIDYDPASKAFYCGVVNRTPDPGPLMTSSPTTT